jgi:hypothetical protein
MKKQYEAPSVEVVRFQYSDQVVASSGDGSVQVLQGNVILNHCEYMPIN